MRRFWKEVSLEQVDGGWRVLLDGRAIKTQNRAEQIVPTRALAELLAGEWSSQGETIDPAAFPMRDMADYAIDMIAADRAGAIGKLLRFAETDTLCYRAHPDEPLHKRQWSAWEPIVSAFEKREGVRLERVSGVLHKPQPPATLAAIRLRLEAMDAFVLAPLEAMASLSASLVVALSALDAEADIDELWAAAELEETWQMELWGSDWEAEQRRERRKADFLRATEFARAATG
ncbi:ATP12 family chaperone protein [Tsuneonella sp. HG249]